MVDVIDISATVVDTLASSYEYMSRNDLLGKVIAKLTALYVEHDGVDDEDEDVDDEDEDVDDEDEEVTMNAEQPKATQRITCPRCGFYTWKMSTYINHTNRKNMCKPTKTCVKPSRSNLILGWVS